MSKLSSIDELSSDEIIIKYTEKAEEIWDKSYNTHCDFHDKQMWINGFISGCLNLIMES